MRERREDRCPRCKHRGFKAGAAPADGRPEFTCTSCGYSWTCGKDGGGFMSHAKEAS